MRPSQSRAQTSIPTADASSGCGADGTEDPGEEVRPSQTPAAGDAYHGEALALLRKMMGASMRSLQVGRQLMLAQDLALRHRQLADARIEAAAASGGDLRAIQQAVEASRAADLSDEQEWALSREWGAQMLHVHALVDLAEELLADSARPVSG